MSKEEQWEAAEFVRWLVNGGPASEARRIIWRFEIDEDDPRLQGIGNGEPIYDLEEAGEALEEWAKELGLVEAYGIYENNRNPDPIDWQQVAGDLA